MPSTQTLTSLTRFSSCDIGDALIKLEVPYGGYLHGLKQFSPTSETKIFGPAYTVLMVAANNTTAPKTDKHFADGIERDSVVFVSQPKGMYSACWGGLMSTRAKYLGALGVVVDGNFRDVGEQRGLGFPVFARGSSALGSNRFTRASAVNVPVEFTSAEQSEPLTISPGDLILADLDGVVVVPPDKVDECLAICEERAKIDALTVEALERGEEMGATLARLRK